MATLTLTVGRLMPDRAHHAWFYSGIMNNSIQTVNIGDDYNRNLSSHCNVWIADLGQYQQANVGDVIRFDTLSGKLTIERLDTKKTVDNATRNSVRAMATNTSRNGGPVEIVNVSFDSGDINDSVLRVIQELTEFVRRRDRKTVSGGKQKLVITLQ